MTSESGEEIDSLDSEISYRSHGNNKKKRNWKKAFAQRRKTFTGFTIAEEENGVVGGAVMGGSKGVDSDIQGRTTGGKNRHRDLKMRVRPKSMLLPDRSNNLHAGGNEYFMKLSRNKSVAATTPKPSRNNTFSSSRTTVIEHKLSNGTSAGIEDSFGVSPKGESNPPEQMFDARVSISRKKRAPPPDIILDIEGIDCEQSQLMQQRNEPLCLSREEQQQQQQPIQDYEESNCEDYTNPRNNNKENKNVPIMQNYGQSVDEKLQRENNLHNNENATKTQQHRTDENFRKLDIASNTKMITEETAVTTKSQRVRHHHHHRKRKKKDPKAKDTWSKYLDVNPKRHEVYCALNSIKKRLRGSGRGVRGALKKSESVHLQRNASTVILDEKKDSMR